LNGSSAGYSSAPSSGTAYTVDSVQWVGEVYNQGEIVITSAVTFSGNCSSTQGFILRAATGASFIDNASAATNGLRYNPADGAAIAGYVPYLSCSIQAVIPTSRSADCSSAPRPIPAIACISTKQ